MAAPGPGAPRGSRSVGGTVATGTTAVSAGVTIYFLTFQNLIVAAALPAGAILVALAATAIVTRTHDAQLKRLTMAVVDDPSNPDLHDELEEKLLTLPLHEVARALQLIDGSSEDRTDEFVLRMRRGRAPMRERIRQSIAEVLESRGQ